MNSKEIAERIRGKLTLLYGAPTVGKTILGFAVSRHFQTPYLVKVDTNIPQEYIQINQNLQVIEADSLRRIYAVLERPPRDADFLMIDSITSVAAEVVGEQLLSPRRNLALSNFYDYAFRRLAKLKPKTTVLVIAHEAIKDFQSGKVGPRLNQIALRHCDLVYRLVVEDGKRRLVKELDRGGHKKIELDWEVVE